MADRCLIFNPLKKEKIWENQVKGEAAAAVHADQVDQVDREAVDTRQLQGIHQVADERTVPANKTKN